MGLINSNRRFSDCKPKDHFMGTSRNLGHWVDILDGIANNKVTS